MTIESVEPGMKHGGLQSSSGSAIPVTGAEVWPKPGEFHSRNRHKVLQSRHPIFWMSPATITPTIEAVPGASAQAIVSEIETCAARFAASGENASIDLRFLRGMPEEREMLSDLLGRGEISAIVNALGRTEIRETAVPCVWWVSHCNSEGEIVGEMIEVTEVPEMIMGDRMAVARGLEAFRNIRSTQTPPPYHNAR